MNLARRAFLMLFFAAMTAAGLGAALFAPAAKAEFVCEYDIAGKSDNGFTEWHMRHAENIGAYYTYSTDIFGIQGSDEIHEQLRAEVSALELDPSRTPLIHADLNTGRIRVFYCAETRCTLEEENAALRACMDEFSAEHLAKCSLYAIRIDGITLCRLNPVPW
jgi:hypothetical protein